MSIQKFEDIICWQKSRILTNDIYEAFKFLKDFNFKDQICRASVSITCNIAEGFERKSKRDFARFLYIAIGSASEVKSLLYLALDRNYLSTESHLKLIEQSNEVSKIIRGLIKSLEK